ncbi:MAG: AGE family epimerase/isomerase [Saprospiraceae bacterium]|nr:AGE family epimerase/isomerase [Saprospiraceae bacterium]
MLLSLFRSEIQTELTNILDWWTTRMTDNINGGFYGRIDGHGNLHRKANKGIILNTRILWTYSKVFQQSSDPKYQILADRAYQYICRYFWDHKNQGVYWMLDYHGIPVNTQKQVYAQAFAIYAFSAYYEINPTPDVLEKIELTFQCIEKHSRDKEKGGYLNVFNQDWSIAKDQKLSEKDADQIKIMNTHLHVLEAYTSLYGIKKEAVYREALNYVLHIYLSKFCVRDPCHLYLYFDEDWQPTSEEKSFGHDIESSWLILEAAESLNEPNITLTARKVSIALADATYKFGQDKNGGIYEKTDASGIEIEKEKHWWPQAEAVVGYLNAWQISGDEKYLTIALQTWHFIQNHFVDTINGEWHWLIKEDGQPDLQEDKAGPWKAPYHNVRMCLEVLHRLKSPST